MHFQVAFTTIPLKLAIANVRAVASGLRHSAIITRDGHGLVCGNGKNGQLGLTNNNGTLIVEVEHPQKGTQNMSHSMLWDCYRRTVKVQHGAHKKVSSQCLKPVHISQLSFTFSFSELVGKRNGAQCLWPINNLILMRESYQWHLP
jgi:hypothetical protein